MSPELLLDFWPRLGELAGAAWQTIAVLLFAAISFVPLRNPPDEGIKADHFARFGGFDIWFVCLIVISVLILRSPTWMLGQTNVDEAQWIAGTITLEDHYAFWGTVDGMTSGPLITHALYAWNTLFGVIGFQSAKVFTTVIWSMVVVFTYLGLSQLMERRLARLLICPFVGLVALMHDPGYVGYNGEQITVLLLAISAMLLCRIFVVGDGGHWTALMLGLALGVLPYSKVQAVPMGILLGIYGLVLLYRKPAFFTLLLTVVISNALILGSLAATGLLNDFWTSYILENVEYTRSVSGVPLIKRPYGFIRVWFSLEEGRIVVIMGLVMIVLAGWLSLRRTPPPAKKVAWMLWGAVAYLATAAFCVLLPGTFFSHYFLFMFHPLLLSMAISIFICRTVVTDGNRSRIDRAVILFLFLGASVPSFVHYPAFMAAAGQALNSEISPVSKRLIELAGPDTKLSVWGWAPHLHADTLLPQATSEALTARQIHQGPYQDYFTNRYLFQLAQTTDLLFVDATNSLESKYFKDPAFAHRQYPAVDEFVAGHLMLVDTINGARIYRRPTAKEIGDRRVD